jgi:hypothetical protein
MRHQEYKQNSSEHARQPSLLKRNVRHVLAHVVEIRRLVVTSVTISQEDALHVLVIHIGGADNAVETRDGGSVVSPLGGFALLMLLKLAVVALDLLLHKHNRIG